jgi:type I restriction enzyme M protein
MSKGRILAVVSLGANTFKPHTGIKTSILFLQKYDENLCPQRIDYPIFFAVSKKSGKDNSGNYEFQRNEKGEVILDEHGHPKVDHDLDEIADSFIQFAKKEKLSFC